MAKKTTTAKPADTKKKTAAKPAPVRKTAAPPKPKPAPPRTKISKSPAPRSAKSPALDILMVTSEARPFAKTGGLADVCGALPRALARLGHRVTLVLPKYRDTPTDGSPGTSGDVPFGLHRYPVRYIEQTVAEGVTAVLID